MADRYSSGPDNREHNDKQPSLGKADALLPSLGTAISFPLNTIRQITNLLLEDPQVTNLSMLIKMPACPQVVLLLAKDKGRLGTDWMVDESRVQISATIDQQLQNQDIYELLHEMGHIYARHALRHNPISIFPEIALLKEEHWCWQFAHDVGTASGLIESSQEFLDIATLLNLSYIKQMVSHARSGVAIPLDMFEGFPQGNSALHPLDCDQIAALAQTEFSIAKIHPR